MNPKCPSTNIDNISEPYEFIEDIYYEIKSEGINFYNIENNNLVLYGVSSNSQTRPTYLVSGGIILKNNNVIRGSAYKINEFNFILDNFTINE